MNKFKMGTAALLCATALASPSLAMDQATFEARIDQITAEYEPRLTALAAQADALDDDAPSEAEVIINLAEWEKVSFSMHVPEVKMDRWDYSMHIPETTMKQRGFSWHVPDCRWDIVDFGPFGKTKFLKCGRKLHEWSTKVPEVTMKQRDFAMDIPEVTMKQRDFSFHLLKIHVGGPQDKLEGIQSDAEAIQWEAEEIAAKMEAEIGAETRLFLTAQKADAEKQFSFALKTLEAGIKSAPNETVRAELVAQRKAIQSQRTTLLAEIDSQLAALA